MKKKINLWLFIFIYLLWGWLIFADNLNILSLSPSVTTGRYFCPITINVLAKYGGAEFSNCQYGLKYNPSNESLIYNKRWSDFSQTDVVWYSTWNFFFWEEKNDNWIKKDAVCSQLTLNPNTTNMTKTELTFVTNRWTEPVVDDFLSTNDKLNLSWGGSDTLTWVESLEINYEMCPCVLDSTAPQIGNFSDNLNSANFLWKKRISALVYDKWWVSWNYWFSGKDIKLENYVSWAPNWMDNQEWVNSGTISVTIHYDSSYGVPDEIYTWSSLNLLPYTWTISEIPSLTWDNNVRWYRFSFENNNNDYIVEKPITITITASDNDLSMWSVCSRGAKSNTWTYTINKAVAPTISLYEPVNWSSFKNPWTSVSLLLKDNLAWINTGSVIISIPEIYSWEDLLLTWYIYSWSDLSFSWYSWEPGLWNSWSYIVTFQPKEKFPVNKEIFISWYVEDLAWNKWSWIESFSTRPDCSLFWCLNTLWIDVLSESMYQRYLETNWPAVIVTWTFAPYPYLTWENNEILMCWPVDTSVVLSWNIDIYEDWNKVNWNSYEYSWLHITWLDFVYENWVIIID